jgi:hypothetical protein
MPSSGGTYNSSEWSLRTRKDLKCEVLQGDMSREGLAVRMTEGRKEWTGGLEVKGIRLEAYVTSFEPHVTQKYRQINDHSDVSNI